MKVSIRQIEPIKIIGLRKTMSIQDNHTKELWSSFMRRRHEVRNPVGTELYSIQKYGRDYFQPFRPDAPFEKIAGVKVDNFEHVPDEMISFIIDEGAYAVFHYRGPVSEAPKVFQYIFGTWLPQSDFVLDHRPHFELIGEKYSNTRPDSEEDIFIPIKRK